MIIHWRQRWDRIQAAQNFLTTSVIDEYLSAPAAGPTKIVLTTLAGREIEFFSGEVLAVEEQLTEVRSPVYAGVRSRVYIEDHRFAIRDSAANVITTVQAVDPFTATIVVTTFEGRQITILAASIAAVHELLADVRSPVYTGDRSRLFLELHVIDVRLTAAALIALIEAA